MHRLFVLKKEKCGGFAAYALISIWSFLLCSGIGAFAQNTTTTSKANPPVSIRATHLMGFSNTKNNSQGTLTAQDHVLRFEQSNKTIAQLDISAVRNVYLGEESLQVGGTPAKIGKAVAPFGSGRVVSLFAHKKYDTLTVEFADSNGGIHGAIFQLKKGQGELMKDELVALGAPFSSGQAPTKLSTLEVTHEDN